MKNIIKYDHKFNTRGLCEDCGLYKWEVDIIEVKKYHLTINDKNDTLSKD